LRLQLISRASARIALLLVAGAWLAPSGARAYSSFADYVRPIEEGGGGGKLFTGTPADGYTCDVCHRGAVGSSLQVMGLPEAGYVPGQTYQLSFQWDNTLRVALMAELTDRHGAPAGVSALAPYSTWTDAEKCAQDGFPAADLCRAGQTGVEAACCRDIDATKDACSFPGERSVLWMVECGAHAARLTWTAPVQGGDVWFSASMLTSNAGNDAEGDGVTLVRRRLHPVGATDVRAGATGSCQLQPGARGGAGVMFFVLGVVLCLGARLRRQRAR
jgi:hypothetical protein